jgi:hypothetical protein
MAYKGGGGIPVPTKKTKTPTNALKIKKKMLSLITGKIRNKTENKHC